MENHDTMTIETVDRQRRYVEAQKEKGQGLGLVFADAFLRGMRDIGYKNPAWALAEEIDNSFQAAATLVSIRLGFAADNKSQAKPDLLAVCDDGNGMIPEMISYAVRWGGTDRENDRNGFGRYGYGLPSSLVSLAKRYTVFSKVDGTDWHAVTVDIEELAKAAGDISKTESILSPRKRPLPAWLVRAEDKLDLSSLNSGTVIVLEDLDRLRRLSGWIQTKSLHEKLLKHFGVIYRHWIPERRIFVHGVQTLPVDPLFLMEHARFYDETSVRAERVETRTFEVETSRGTTGRVAIRASVLPPNFQSADPMEKRPDRRGAKTNKRWMVMREYNGFLVCRERRQIDCISPPWTKFQNEDSNVKIEIDFDPELDEFFGITTAKQQIEIDEDMWEKLKQSGRNCGGLHDLVHDMRTRFRSMKEKLKAEAGNEEAAASPPPSAIAMEQSAKFKGSVPEPTTEQRRDAQRNLDEAARARARAAGKTTEEARNELVRATSMQRWAVEFDAIPEGPFYRPMRLGEQKRVIINTEHPFYTKLYENGGPDVQAGLQVLLFVLAERELEVQGDAETFYKAERQKWSERFRNALNELLDDDSLVDKAASVAEQLHMAVN